MDSSATRPTQGDLTIEVSQLDGPFVYRQGYRPFKAERRVRFPHGLLEVSGGMWESLVIRLPWEQENAGPNPAIPTEAQKGLTSSVEDTSVIDGRASGRTMLRFCRPNTFLRGEQCAGISTPNLSGGPPAIAGYTWHKNYIQAFCDSIPAMLTLDQLKPKMIQRLVEQSASPQVGEYNGQAFPFPTESRAEIAADEWIRGY